ncbi:hypothetical protein GH714_001127 [Hevea brasiliensis]|uniref:Rx N-terminal domain-containing protein n=1 Tax=Hevea brasiliensis TaxID=3981 RepID=A0A6A6MB36_HEVBR|nr:hypothetical protein GH714_001127 [Hevea brasiliensis]
MDRSMYLTSDSYLLTVSANWLFFLMETVAVIRDAILSASLQLLIDRLVSLDLLKYASSGQVLAELLKWESMLKKIDAVLDDAEEKQMTNQLVKIWLNDLRDLAYDVEDIIDEFSIEALRHKLEVEPVARAGKNDKNNSTVDWGRRKYQRSKFASGEIDENLSGKKFFIVLDDVWNESYEDWTLFYGPLEAGALGSKIIVTTRNQGVSSMMGTVPTYTLNELSYNDCRSVFTEHALGTKEFDAQLNLEEIEGFLQQPKERKPTKHLGHEYFDDLLSRSFFQQSGGSKPRYVMHHLVSDLAQSITGEICYNLDDALEGAKSYAKVRHSSFTCHYYDNKPRFEVIGKMRSLRTFLAVPISSSPYHLHYLSGSVLNDMVPELKLLRVLSLTGYNLVELPNSIGTLKLLRYLNLSYTNIRKLPESLSELFNLQTLRLRRCMRLVRLPEGIGSLINLQYLDITDTISLQEMPPHMGNLTNLCMLSKFIVGTGIGYGIIELMKLSHLQGQLHISGLQNVASIIEADLAHLKEKKGLMN